MHWLGSYIACLVHSVHCIARCLIIRYVILAGVSLVIIRAGFKMFQYGKRACLASDPTGWHGRPDQSQEMCWLPTPAMRRLASYDVLLQINNK